LVEFRILGPLEVRDDGRVLDIGGPRDRRILAALLLDGNRVVPLHRLVEAAWDGRPPATAERQVRNRVAALRAQLTAAGAHIETEGHGYRLRIAPGKLDADVFDDLVARGRAAADPALLRAALALWRGPALAGLGGVAGRGGLGGVGGTLAARAAALEDRRLAAIEDRVALDLAAGDHDCVDELRALVAAHPLRERLVGQLMTALHRSGRVAEALAVYDALAARLADELGLDPSPEVRRLRETVAREPAALTPQQLPAGVAGFTGREADLAALDRFLADSQTDRAVVISAIAGTAGVGKTALALHWAHRVRDKFADGQLYVNLRGFASAPPVAPVDALGGFLRALAVPAERIPSDLAGAVALYRETLAGRRVLVVLDNAATADQVRPLLPATPGCLALVTSRNVLDGLDARRLALDVLDPVEAVALLARIVGDDRVDAEPGAAAEVARLCGYLPLALRIAAANLDGSFAAYVERLAAGNRLAALEVDGDRQAAVRAAFDLSYERLDEPARRLFRLLGLVPGPDITADAAASLAAVDVGRVRRLLGRLAGAHLVDRAGDRYSLHDLIRLYAAALPDDGRPDAILRLVDHYLHTAYGATRLLDPHRHPVTLDPQAPGVTPLAIDDRERALAWFIAEHAGLRALVDLAEAGGHDTRTWALAWALATYFHRQGHLQDWVATHEAAIRAADRLGDRLAAARAHRNLALALIRMPGRADDGAAHFERALALHAEVGDLLGQANTHQGLAMLREQQGRSRDALDHVRQSHDLYERTGDRAGQAAALNGIGWYHAQFGEYEPALTYCRRALDLQREVGDPAMEANTWDSLGYAHHHLAEYRAAVDCFRRAIDLYRQVGERFGEADALAHLGDALDTAGDPAGARQAWEEAFAILDEIDHPKADEVRARLGPVA
jgi:DNA-binding SARP family transcriptional activator/tetratricopeptide (TPR) repeat protein